MDYWDRSSYKRKNCLLGWPEDTAAKIKNFTLFFIALIYVQNSGYILDVNTDTGEIICNQRHWKYFPNAEIFN